MLQGGTDSQSMLQGGTDSQFMLQGGTDSQSMLQGGTDSQSMLQGGTDSQSMLQFQSEMVLAVSRQRISKETLWQTCDSCMPYTESRWFPTVSDSHYSVSA